MELVVLCPEASASRARFFTLSLCCAHDAHSLSQFPVVSSISVTVCWVILSDTHLTTHHFGSRTRFVVYHIQFTWWRSLDPVAVYTS